MRGAEEVVAALAVLEPEDVAAVLGPAVRGVVGLLGQQRREEQLLGAHRVHLVADDLLDLAQHPQPEREPGVDARSGAAHVAGTHQQPVAGHLRVVGVLAQGSHEEGRHPQDHVVRLRADAAPARDRVVGGGNQTGSGGVLRHESSPPQPRHNRITPPAHPTTIPDTETLTMRSRRLLLAPLLASLVAACCSLPHLPAAPEQLRLADLTRARRRPCPTSSTASSTTAASPSGCPAAPAASSGRRATTTSCRATTRRPRSSASSG